MTKIAQLLISLALLAFFVNSVPNSSPMKGASSESMKRTAVTVNYDCSCGKKTTLRIVSGHEVEPHAYPWMVALYYMGRFHCGGSLINDRYVLTAAHCTDGRIKIYFEAVLGMHDRPSFEVYHSESVNVFKIKRIIVHPRDHDGMNDISLMELKRPVGQLHNVGKICLPVDIDFVDYDAKVLGWGRTREGGEQSRFLKEATVTVVSNEQCQRGLPEFVIGSDVICAFEFGTDACQADSGGPLFVEKDGRYQLIGIVSGGIGCARPLPAVYTRVTKFMDWIIDETQNGVYCN